MITFRVRPEDVVRYRETLRARLAVANRRYAEVIVPRALAAEDAARAKEQERVRIIADAQRLFDLDPEFDEEAPVVEVQNEPAEPPASEGWAHRVAERAGRALTAS